MQKQALKQYLLVIMDIQAEPEYDDSPSFSNLIRESKKYLIIFA